MVSNINLLLAQKGQNERRRITLNTAADESGVSYYTLRAIANNTISEYPKAALAKLCAYFGCTLDDLLVLKDEPART